MTGPVAGWAFARALAATAAEQPPTVGDPTQSSGTHVALVVLLVAVAMALVVSVVYLRRTFRNWSSEGLVRRWARGHGWRYTRRNDTLSLNWPEDPFGYAARTSYNVVFGNYRGHRTTMFDIGDRSTSSLLGQLPIDNKDKLQDQLHGHVASSVVMDLPFFVETDFTLRPLRGWSRLWAHDRGRTHIELENEDFNRLYDVICTDRDLAYAFLTPRTIEILLSQPPTEIRVRGMQALLIDDKPLRPARINRWLAMLSAFVENVSPYVWTDRATESVERLSDMPPLTPDPQELGPLGPLSH